MKTRVLEFSDYEKIKEIVESDGVIAFPTETVYGLGVRHDSFLAYTKIFEAKMRPENKSLTLMLYDKNDIEKYAVIDDKVRNVINVFMPGALTLVLPKQDEVEIYGSDETIGIRIPDNQETLELLKGIKIPMFVTSANISGNKAAENFDEVKNELDGRIEAIVQGEVRNGQASTIVSIINDELKLLREGPIALKKIEEVYNNG